MWLPSVNLRPPRTAKLFGLLTLVLGPAVPGLAQDPSRSTDLRELVRLSEKFLDFTGSDHGSEELGWIEELDSFSRRHDLVPEVGGVVSGSGIGFGLEHTLWRDADDAFGWRGLRTFKGYQELGLFHTRTLGGSLVRKLGTELEYRDLPQESFYGLGGDSSRDAQTHFRLIDYRVRSGLWLNLTNHLGLSIRGSFRNVQTRAGTNESLPQPGQILPEEAIPGFRETFNYGGLGVRLVWDRRDTPRYSRRGTLVAGEVDQFLGFSENAPAYRRFSVEVQHFLPLPGHDHRLATRAKLDGLDHESDASLPFFLSRGLGGSHSLRSFPLNRFRGENIALATVEYRAAVLPGKLEAVVFWDTGGVYQHLRDFSPESLKHSFGGGVRILRSDRVLVRFDVARGSEGTRFLLSFSGTF